MAIKGVVVVNLAEKINLRRRTRVVTFLRVVRVPNLEGAVRVLAHQANVAGRARQNHALVFAEAPVYRLQQFFLHLVKRVELAHRIVHVLVNLIAPKVIRLLFVYLEVRPQVQIFQLATTRSRACRVLVLRLLLLH